MLTAHELDLVIGRREIEGLAPQLSKSRTIQAVLSELSQSELDACKKASTFAELMELVAEQKSKRERR